MGAGGAAELVVVVELEGAGGSVASGAAALETAATKGGGAVEGGWGWKGGPAEEALDRGTCRPAVAWGRGVATAAANIGLRGAEGAERMPVLPPPALRCLLDAARVGLRAEGDRASASPPPSAVPMWNTGCPVLEAKAEVDGTCRLLLLCKAEKAVSVMVWASPNPPPILPPPSWLPPPSTLWPIPLEE